jgi:hypothetical protein
LFVIGEHKTVVKPASQNLKEDVLSSSCEIEEEGLSAETLGLHGQHISLIEFGRA